MRSLVGPTTIVLCSELVAVSAVDSSPDSEGSSAVRVADAAFVDPGALEATDDPKAWSVELARAFELLIASEVAVT